MPKDIAEVFDTLTELWNTGKPELAAQVYSERAQRTDPNQPQPARGPQEIAKYVAQVRSAFSDFTLTINQRIGEADQVFTEWTCTGTHNGEFLGVPATGRRIEVTGVTVDRIRDNQIVEERVYFDRLALLQQLGAAPGLMGDDARRAAGGH